MRWSWMSLAVWGALLLANSGAIADTWPARPVKIVVAYPAGGAIDIVARELAQRLGKLLDQSFYVENRPGASGNTGTDYVAKAAPDGYTLLLGADIQFAIAPNFDSNLPYQVKDFAPVSLVADTDQVLAAPASLPASTIGELVALARQQPGKINYGSTGPGSTHELAMELLQQRGAFTLTEVPYRGAGQALPDLLSGRIQLMLLGVAGSLPHLQSGQLKALGVASSRRVPALPNTATIAEQGFPGFEASVYNCLYAPAGTPVDIITKLQQATIQALSPADLRERFLASGITPVGSTAEALAAHIERDSAKWASVLRTMHAHASPAQKPAE